MTYQRRGMASAPLMIQTRTSTVDSVGQTTDLWADFAKVWARVETRGGVGKGEFAGTITAVESKVAVIDYRNDVEFSVKDTRLVSRGATPQVVYNIAAISDRGLLHHTIELELDEVTP